MSTNGRETGTFQVKSGLAQMLKGGVADGVIRRRAPRRL